VKPRVILLLITTFDMGGAERVYIQLALGLAARGYKVIAACLQWRSGIVARELEGTAVSIVDLNFSSRADVRGFVRLLRLIRRSDVDVVYTFLIHPHVLGRFAARINRVPIILSSQQTMLYENKLLEWLNRFTARWCAAIVAVSRNVQEYLAVQVKLPRRKLVTIYNSVDTRRLRGRPATRVHRDEGPIVGYCARLTPEKDHSGLMRAIALVRDKYPAVRLLLAGEGPERERLARVVEDQRLTDTVRFLGHVNDVSAFYSRLDIYVQSSYVEGLPCAVLEALASELPVVATRVGGNEEILAGGDAGILVPPRDPVALAEAILWIADNAEIGREMGVRGRRIVEDRFSTDSMVSATDSLISTLWESAANR
jgi:glycosyltransferase involved in cell wall biosynthesis